MAISVKNLQTQIDNLTSEINNIKTALNNKTNFIQPTAKGNAGTVKYLKIFKMVREPGISSCQVSFIASLMSDYGSKTPEINIVSLSTRASNRIPMVTILTGNTTEKRWFTTDDGTNIWLWCKTEKWPSTMNLHLLTVENIVDYKTTGVFESSETEPPDIIWQDNNILNSDIVYGAVFN